jgi:hypothetical protein
VIVRSHRSAALLVACALSLSGCGELFEKVEYDAATFTGRPGGPYMLSTGQLPLPSQVQHQTIADVFVRFNDGTVFELAQLPEAESKSRSGAESDVHEFHCYHLRDATAQFYYRDGRIVGAVLAGNLPIASSEQGPFLTVPLSALEVRELFGHPRRQAKYRGPMKWN